MLTDQGDGNERLSLLDNSLRDLWGPFELKLGGLVAARSSEVAGRAGIVW